MYRLWVKTTRLNSKEKKEDGVWKNTPKLVDTRRLNIKHTRTLIQSILTSNTIFHDVHAHVGKT